MGTVSITQFYQEQYLEQVKVQRGLHAVELEGRYLRTAAAKMHLGQANNLMAGY